ncbi:MAG: hypothetical protein AMXMBFR7_32040 [Planctomycetota bacterium]
MAENQGTTARPRILAGFEVLEKIGQGNMGAVFKARQISMDREVALKILPPKVAQDPGFIERFLREARASGQLNHPNIVQGIDAGFDKPSGLYYFAMEYIDGPSLKTVLKEKGKLPESEVRKIAQEMGEALKTAEAQGLVHRDIKPDNILLTTRGAAKLADLGLAKKIEGEGEEEAELTQAGKAVGTPFYMAPEQIRGQNDQIDIRTDFYALGATLFHLVTGEAPFKGGTAAEIMAKHLTEKIPLAHQCAEGVSEPFSRLLSEMMQKEKSKRPESTAAFLDRLSKLDASRSGGRWATTGPRAPIGAGKGTTGPRKPLGRTTLGMQPIRVPGEEPVTPRASKPPVAVYVAGGAVLLLGLAALFMSGRGEPADGKAKTAKLPQPVVQPPRESPQPVSRSPDGPASKASPAAPAANDKLVRDWQRAQDYAREHPDSFASLADRYAKVIEAAQGDPAGAEIAAQALAAREALNPRWATAAEAAWVALAAQVAEQRAQNKYDPALKALNAPPRDFRERLAERAEALSTELKAEADAKAEALAGKAKAALEAADFEAADAALAEAALVDYAPLEQQIRSIKKDLATARKAENAEAAKQLAAAKQAWAGALAKFDAAALDAGDTEAARRAAEGIVKDPALALLEAERGALQGVAETFGKLKERERAELAKLVGQQVDWTVKGEKLSGKVREVRADAVVLDAQMRGANLELPVKLSDLAEAERAKFIPKLDPQGPAEQVAAAILKLKKGAEDAPGARALLEAASASPLAAHYLAKVKALELGAKGMAAEAALKEFLAKAEAEAKPTPDRAKELLLELANLRAEHAGTAPLKAQAGALKRQEERLQTAAALPTAADLALAAKSVLKNGGFEGNGLEGWRIRTDHPDRIKHVTDGAHGGKGAVSLVAGPQKDKFDQGSPVEANKVYAVSMWVKVLKAEGNETISAGYGSKGQNHTIVKLPSGPIGQWQKVTFEHTPSQTWCTLWFDLRLREKGSAYEFMVDDVVVVEKE